MLECLAVHIHGLKPEREGDIHSPRHIQRQLSAVKPHSRPLEPLPRAVSLPSSPPRVIKPRQMPPQPLRHQPTLIVHAPHRIQRPPLPLPLLPHRCRTRNLPPLKPPTSRPKQGGIQQPPHIHCAPLLVMPHIVMHHKQHIPLLLDHPLGKVQRRVPHRHPCVPRPRTQEHPVEIRRPRVRRAALHAEEHACCVGGGEAAAPEAHAGVEAVLVGEEEGVRAGVGVDREVGCGEVGGGHPGWTSVRVGGKALRQGVGGFPGGDFEGFVRGEGVGRGGDGREEG